MAGKTNDPYPDYSKRSQILNDDKKPKVWMPSEGDWQCPRKECQNWNFPVRWECNKCYTLKPKDARIIQTNGKPNISSENYFISNRERSRSKSKNRERYAIYDWIADNDERGSIGRLRGLHI